MALFEKSSTIPFPREEVFRWHSRTGALERLSPPWQEIRVLRNSGNISVGAEVELELKIGPLWKRWLARHTALEDGRLFRDEQIRGPFSKWIHTHLFEDSPEGCKVTDQIEFEVPLSLGLADGAVDSALHRTFAYRHETLRNDLSAAKAIPSKPLRILISGATGLVGRALTAFLQTAGHEVHILTRRSRGHSNEIEWNPSQSFQELPKLENFDAVVHLAGENIAKGRWTENVKRELYSSRIDSTKILVDAFRKLQNKPKVFVCASAIGFYGDRGEELLDETSASGTNFLSKICKDWEAEAQKAEELGIRTTQVRIGVVLTPAGGALKKMLTPFKLGIGGVLGPGTQYVSWIGLDDLVYSFARAIIDPQLVGPINACTPNPLNFRDFSKTLAKALGRSLGPPVPAIILRAIAGQLADELLLASIRATPKKLLDAGYQFTYSDLERAFRHLLGLKNE